MFPACYLSSLVPVDYGLQGEFFSVSLCDTFEAAKKKTKNKVLVVIHVTAKAENLVTVERLQFVGFGPGRVRKTMHRWIKT